MREDERNTAPTAAAEAGHFTCELPDMECADCAAKVEEALRRQAGVLDLSISVVARKARSGSTRPSPTPNGSARRSAGPAIQ